MRRADPDRQTVTFDDWPTSRGEIGDAVVPGLTIAWHPDPSRVGQRATFDDGSMALSRLTPVFHREDGAADGPLVDPHVSRTPVELRLDGGGVRISGRATVDGERLRAPRWIAPPTLARGVTIGLARRVLFWLHFVPAAPYAGPRHGLIGDSVALRRLCRDIGRLGRLSAPVLVRGDSGTGKELVARAVHGCSARAHAPYRAVNAAAIPAPTAVAAFFGHRRGAFSGAVSDGPGYFGESDGGTLFLDEIGELPPALQPMLLRALETGEIQPVGAARARGVDVRVIAATDAPLEAAMEQGVFSRPLFHRLAGAELWLPRLTDRRDDIPRLLVYALRRELGPLGAGHRLDGHLADHAERGRPWLDIDIVRRLMAHDWPGNVRELLNLARQIAAAAFDRSRVRIEEVPALRRLFSPPPASTSALSDASTVSDTSSAPSAAPPEPPPPDGEVELTPSRALDALQRARWSMHGAARALGVPKSTLYRFVERRNLLRKAGDIPDAELRAVYAESGGDRGAMADRLRVSGRALARRLAELDPPIDP